MLIDNNKYGPLNTTYYMLVTVMPATSTLDSQLFYTDTNTQVTGATKNPNQPAAPLASTGGGSTAPAAGAGATAGSGAT